MAAERWKLKKKKSKRKGRNEKQSNRNEECFQWTHQLTQHSKRKKQ